MARIIPLTRRAPMVRLTRPPDNETESREAAREMRILLWTFAITALAMCVTVAAFFCHSWAELWLISSFLLVFTLFKIGLANALFYLMVRCDADKQAARLASRQAERSSLTFRRPAARRRPRRAATATLKPPRPRAPA